MMRRTALAGILLAALGSDGYGQAVPTWRLARELRIGSIDGGLTALTHVNHILPASDTLLYVTQWSVPQVTIFDARDGRGLGVLGRRGSGPGEFSAPGRMGHLGDTLWIGDPMLGRFSLFVDHRHVGDVRVPAFSGPVGPFGLVPDGLLVQESRSAAAMAADPEAKVAVARVARSGAAVDTIAWTAFPRVVRVDVGGRYLNVMNPFRTGDVKAVAPDGSVLVIVEQSESPGAFVLVALDVATGDTLMSRRFDDDPVRVEDRHVQAAIDRIAGRLDAATRRLVEENLDVPSHLTPVTGLFVGGDGTWWVRREEAGPTVRWQVIGRDGVPLAHVLLPAATRLHAAGREHVWGVETDSMDVPYIVRYRIRR